MVLLKQREIPANLMKYFERQHCTGCYLHHLTDIFREVKRVLKDDGTLFVNLGDSYGGSGGSTGHTSETKNLRRKTFDYGAYPTYAHTKQYQAKSMMQIPSRFCLLMTDELGFLLRNRIIWEKNVMPSSATDRFTNNYEDIFFFSKKTKYYFEQQLEPANYDGRKDTRFKGSDKYNSNAISPDGSINTFAKDGHERWTEINGIKMRNKRAVWKVSSESLKEEHFATYPQKLIEPMIKAGCPEEICNKCNKPVIKTYNKGIEEIIVCNHNAGFHPGVILDPFIGSGTSGIVARKLNRNYIGIDLKYFDIQDRRIEKELGFFK